jgi:hypothetical protein
MGYTWKYIRKDSPRYKELDEIMLIVNKVFNLDIKQLNRKQDIIEARITFSKIARDRGFTYKGIGEFFSKEHGTIINYIKNFEYLARHCPSFIEKYVEVETAFLEKKPAKQMISVNRNHRVTIKSLKNEIERIILQKQIIALEVNKYKRIKDIIEIINERTPTGKEEFIKTKINQMFNGISKYD